MQRAVQPIMTDNKSKIKQRKDLFEHYTRVKSPPPQSQYSAFVSRIPIVSLLQRDCGDSDESQQDNDIETEKMAVISRRLLSPDIFAPVHSSSVPTLRQPPNHAEGEGYMTLDKYSFAQTKEPKSPKEGLTALDPYLFAEKEPESTAVEAEGNTYTTTFQERERGKSTLEAEEVQEDEGPGKMPKSPANTAAATATSNNSVETLTSSRFAESLDTSSAPVHVSSAPRTPGAEKEGEPPPESTIDAEVQEDKGRSTLMSPVNTASVVGTTVEAEVKEDKGLAKPMSPVRMADIVETTTSDWRGCVLFNSSVAVPVILSRKRVRQDSRKRARRHTKEPTDNSYGSFLRGIVDNGVVGNGQARNFYALRVNDSARTRWIVECLFDERSLQTQPPPQSPRDDTFESEKALSMIRASPKVSHFFSTHMNFARVHSKLHQLACDDGAFESDVFVQHRSFCTFLEDQQRYLRIVWREGDSKWCVSLLTAEEQDEAQSRRRVTSITHAAAAADDDEGLRCYYFTKRVMGGGRTPSVQKVIAAVVKSEMNPENSSSSKRWFADAESVLYGDPSWSFLQWTEWSGALYMLGEDGSERHACTVYAMISCNRLQIDARAVRDGDVDVFASKTFEVTSSMPFPDEEQALSAPWKEVALVMMAEGTEEATATTTTTTTVPRGGVAAAVAAVSDLKWKGGVLILPAADETTSHGGGGAFFLDVEHDVETRCLRVKAMHCRSEDHFCIELPDTVVSLPLANGVVPSEVMLPLCSQMETYARAKRSRECGVVWVGGLKTTQGHRALAKLRRTKEEETHGVYNMLWDIVVVSLQLNLSVPVNLQHMEKKLQLGGSPNLAYIANYVDERVEELRGGHEIKKGKDAADVVTLKVPAWRSTISHCDLNSASVPAIILSIIRKSRS